MYSFIHIIIHYNIKIKMFNNRFTLQYGKLQSNSMRTVTMPLALAVHSVVVSSTDTGDYSIIVCAASDFGAGTFKLTTGYNGNGYNTLVCYVAITF